MDFPIYIDTISMGLPIVYFRGSQVEFFFSYLVCVPADCFFLISLVNCADADEMPHPAAFHLGLHCMPKYLFIGIQNEKFYSSSCKSP